MTTVSLLGAVTGDPQDDLDLGRRLLDGSDGVQRLLRVYRPSPTAAFSRRETRMAGFDAAVTAAAAAGFAPAVRPTGGRTAVYDGGGLVVDLVEPTEPHAGHRASYERVAGAVAGALRELGVDAGVGEVPGEYCPGEFSVHARSAVKLAGIAQRATRRARLVSVVLTVAPSPAVVELLTEINAYLDLDWLPASLGSVEQELGAPAPHDLVDRLVAALAPDGVEDVAWHRFSRPRMVDQAVAQA